MQIFSGRLCVLVNQGSGHVPSRLAGLWAFWTTLHWATARAWQMPGCCGEWWCASNVKVSNT